MEVVAQEKSTNKPNTGLTDQLHKDITSSAKISQMETKLFDFYSSNNNICITQTTTGWDTFSCVSQYCQSKIMLKATQEVIHFWVKAF